MPNIIIHLSKEHLQNLISNKDIVVGSSESDASISVAVSSNNMGGSFFGFFREQIDRMRQRGNLRTAETYAAAFEKFRRFRNEVDITPCDITSELMEAFQTWLKNRQLSMNTISFHMRKMRALYNKAVEKGLTVDQHPFRHVYTGIAKTTKRAITLKEMKRIKNLKLDDPILAFARDMFLFSFYTRGMAFVDMAYLRKSDVNGGMLTYRRKKTGQLLSIRWEHNMQKIADCYPSKSGYFLLPIIHSRNGKERNQYRNIQTRINLSLKTVGKMARIGQNLTMYVARHSWASIARQMGVPLNVISHGMGHSNEKTTEIYLKSIDMTIVDNANRRILELMDEK